MPMKIFSILLIISILGVFIFTEIILDCSMITDLHMIFFVLNISFVIHAMILYIKKINNVIIVLYNIYMILFVFCLWINRVRVNKFILFDENNAKIFITNEVNVFFIISPFNIMDPQMKIDFEDLISHINGQIKNRIKNEELNISYDFTKYKICTHEEILKFNRFIDHIHFSKFGRQINYLLKLPIVNISDLKDLNLSLQCEKYNFNIPKNNTLKYINLQNNKNNVKSDNLHDVLNGGSIISDQIHTENIPSTPTLSPPPPPPLPFFTPEKFKSKCSKRLIFDKIKPNDNNINMYDELSKKIKSSAERRRKSFEGSTS